MATNLERPIADPFLKRSVSTVILLSNGALALFFAEHGGMLEGLLYDSRLLVANGMSPHVAIKLQRAWITITMWTLQHPYLRAAFTSMMAYGLFMDTVILQIPWLVTSFLETAAQLILVLASFWIMLFHVEPMTLPHVLSVLLQLLLIQVYSGLWTLVALWTFQSSIEEMIEILSASRGPTLLLTYDPYTQRMSARPLTPGRGGAWRTLGSGAPRMGPGAPGQRLLEEGEEDDEEEGEGLESDEEQDESRPRTRRGQQRASEGFTRGPQIEDISVSSGSSISEETSDTEYPSPGECVADGVRWSDRDVRARDDREGQIPRDGTAAARNQDVTIPKIPDGDKDSTLRKAVERGGGRPEEDSSESAALSAESEIQEDFIPRPCPRAARKIWAAATTATPATVTATTETPAIMSPEEEDNDLRPCPRVAKERELPAATAADMTHKDVVQSDEATTNSSATSVQSNKSATKPPDIIVSPPEEFCTGESSTNVNIQSDTTKPPDNTCTGLPPEALCTCESSKDVNTESKH